MCSSIFSWAGPGVAPSRRSDGAEASGHRQRHPLRAWGGTGLQPLLRAAGQSCELAPRHSRSGAATMLMLLLLLLLSSIFMLLLFDSTRT